MSTALAAALAGLLWASCASGPRDQAAEPEAASAPQATAAADPATRAEIARLWDEMDAWHIRTGAHGADSAGDLPPAPAVPVGARAPAAETAASDVDVASVAAELEDPDATCPAAASDPPPCHDACTLATSICDNAESICRLAGELAGDAWAAGKCADAAAVCRAATARCCDCRGQG